VIDLVATLLYETEEKLGWAHESFLQKILFFFNFKNKKNFMNLFSGD